MACTLNVEAVVWIGTHPDSLETSEYTGGDTLVSASTLGREIENALIFDFDETFFRVDTLAYTAAGNQLKLLTLPYALVYQDFATTIDLYFTFHFTRSTALMALQRYRFREID